MNYYYDIILNWNEEAAYDFYEWNDTDYLELIKKIPLFRIRHKSLIDIISNKIKVNSEFLELVKDRTIISGKNLINKVMYASLFTDGKNIIAIEFNSEGYSISYSKLLIDDELNVLEISYDLRDYPLEYEIVEKLKLITNLRQEDEAKRLITLELNNLYQNKDLAKLKYLYYEYKKNTKENIEEIYKELLNTLKEDFDNNILKLYYIIKLSYHNV